MSNGIYASIDKVCLSSIIDTSGKNIFEFEEKDFAEMGNLFIFVEDFFNSYVFNGERFKLYTKKISFLSEEFMENMEKIEKNNICIESVFESKGEKV